MAGCMVGFAQVPAGMVGTVSAAALRLWVALDLHQRDNGSAWPSRKHLAEDLGCSRDSVDRVVTELENEGWLAVERGGAGRGSTNRYVLLGRPGVVHKGRTDAALTDDKGRKSAALTVDKGRMDAEGRAANLRHRTIDRETEVSGHPPAYSAGPRARGEELAEAVLAAGVLPDHLAGKVSRSRARLIAACAELADGWTPDLLRRAVVDAGPWDWARAAGAVVSWIERQREPPRSTPQPVGGGKCPGCGVWRSDGEEHACQRPAADVAVHAARARASIRRDGAA